MVRSYEYIIHLILLFHLLFLLIALIFESDLLGEHRLLQVDNPIYL